MFWRIAGGCDYAHAAAPEKQPCRSRTPEQSRLRLHEPAAVREGTERVSKMPPQLIRICDVRKTESRHCAAESAEESMKRRRFSTSRQAGSQRSECLVRLGLLAKNRGDPQAAIEAFQTTSSRSIESDADTWYFLGTAYVAGSNSFRRPSTPSSTHSRSIRCTLRQSSDCRAPTSSPATRRTPAST